MVTDGQPRGRPWLLAPLLVVVTFVTYEPVWHAGFIWDDDDYVTSNITLRSLDGLRRIWFQLPATTQYYPLTHTTFWLEYHLWGLNPLGYHVVNVSLHALNAVLLWLVLRKLRVAGAWFAAAIFALHPVQVESVAWITERKNLLSGFFCLSALLAFLRFRPLSASATATAGDWRFYGLLFLGALLSKTAVCCLPVVIVLLMWWKLDHVRKRDVLALIPWFVASLTLGLITVLVESRLPNAGPTDWGLSVVHRGLLAGRALWFYAGKVFWPYPLTFVYPHWKVDASAAWQYLFPLAALAVPIALWSSRRRIGKGALAAVLCFAAMLLPVLGFLNIYFFRYSYVADHFQYLACIGLIALAVSAGAMMAQQHGHRGRGLGTLAAGVVLAVLAVSAWRRAHVYRDLETLWRDTLAKNPNCWLAHNNLGLVLSELGKREEAVRHWKAAAQIEPDYAEAHYNLGLALTQLGKPEEAIAQYQEALRVNPEHARARNNLGVALIKLGKTREAIKQFEQALQIEPNYPEAQNNLAWLLATLAPAEGGNPARAVTLAQSACEPGGHPVAQYLDTLAAAYAAVGRFNDAVTTAEQAIELAHCAGQPQTVKDIETHLESYRAGHPYRPSAEMSKP